MRRYRSKRGIFILAFLTSYRGSLVCMPARKQVGPGLQIQVLSRESLLLTNNVLLIVAAGSSLGTFKKNPFLSTR